METRENQAGRWLSKSPLAEERAGWWQNLSLGYRDNRVAFVESALSEPHMWADDNAASVTIRVENPNKRR
jgi:hypothetical protein